MTTTPWPVESIGDVAEVQGGIQKQPKRAPAQNHYPFLRVANVGRGHLDLEEVHRIELFEGELKKFRLEAGDLLVVEGNGSSDQIGRAAQWLGEIDDCVHQNHLIRVRPGPRLDPAYLAYAWNAPATRAALRQVASSTSGLYTLNTGKVAAITIPVPPLVLQRRIVSDVLRRLSRIHAGVGNLKRAQKRLAIAEQAILMAGTTGRLIPRVPEDQDVEVILKEVLGEVDDSQGAQLELAGLPEIPAHWRWVSLGAIASVVGGVTKDSKRQSDPSFVEVPYLRVANVQRGRLALEDVAMIRVPPAKAETLELQPGDVLFNEGGDRDKLGRGWVWEGQIPRCIHQNHVFRARLNSANISPRLLSWYGNSVARSWFEAAGKQTTNLASINLATLKSLPVPVAPRDEQRMIESELERRLSLFRAAEIEIERSLRNAQSLERSILHNALTGRLGRTDNPQSL